MYERGRTSSLRDHFGTWGGPLRYIGTGLLRYITKKLRCKGWTTSMHSPVHFDNPFLYIGISVHNFRVDVLHIFLTHITRLCDKIRSTYFKFVEVSK